MSFQVAVNGKPYTLWETATVQRSLKGNAGAFSFTNSSTIPIAEYPVKEGDAVTVVIEGVGKIKGFVDDMSSTQDKQNHIVSVSGRDNIQDLIDSSVPDSAKVTEGPVSLKVMCEKVIAALGADIKVIQTVDSIAEFTTEDLQAAESGEKCMDYLVTFARKRQVYLVSDGIGNLLIYRPNKGNIASGALINLKDNDTNNVKSFDVNRSSANRFRKIVCKSQDNYGFNPFADSTDNKGEGVDGDVRESRYLEIQAEESMDDTECGDRAAEESNLRRAGGKNYSATIAGVTQPDGTVWDFGQFVPVNDVFAGFVGMFLIEGVTYSQSAALGTGCVLDCVPPDAYQVEAAESKATARTAKTTGAYSE